MIVGVFLVLLGVSTLLRVFFGWNIPVMRTLFALFLIYMGVKMLTSGHWNWQGNFRSKDSEHVVFERGDFHYDKDARNHYSTVFGSSVVDLTHVPSDGSESQIHIDTVFGETKVVIDPKNVAVIRASAVFGEAKMPNGDMVAFGTLNHKTGGTDKTSDKTAAKSSDKGPAKLKIHANVVFGSIRFISSSDVNAKIASDEDDDN